MTPFAPVSLGNPGKRIIPAASIPGAVFINYIFSSSTNTGANAGAGRLWFNSATPSAINVSGLSDTDIAGADVSGILSLLNASGSTVAGDIRIYKTDDPTAWLQFTIPGSAIISGSGFHAVSVTYSSSSRVTLPFANGDAVTLVFSRSGGVGDTGPQGDIGPSADDEISIMQGLGSTLQFQTFPIWLLTALPTVLTTEVIKLRAFYLRKATTLNGVKWWQGTGGNYTARNYNGVGLFLYTVDLISGALLTLVASSTNDGNIWKVSSGNVGSKGFSSAYDAAIGTYFIAALWCSSSTVTPPGLGIKTNMQNAAMSTFDFANSACLLATLAGSSLPSSQAISGVTPQVASDAWFGLY